MERNEKTTIHFLKTGDRFYKLSDNKKTVLEKVPHEVKKTAYRTYTNWAIDAKYCKGRLTADQIEMYAKPINSETEVVFLRHKELAAQ
jgi:hypothetical protein